jgi:16S rRNA processing protein RimM
VNNGLEQKVVIGRLSGHSGIKGWVKIRSYTRPAEQIFEYPEVFARNAAKQEAWTVLAIEGARLQGKGPVIKIRGIESREDAEPLIGSDVAISRSQMASLPDGEYYWIDLIGCDVVNVQGTDLGRLTSIMETGANDVFVIERKPGSRPELLVPWVAEVVIAVDLGQRLITVDWQEDYLV